MGELVRQVAYLNNIIFPSYGRRRLEMSTRISCRGGTVRQVPFELSSIMVLPGTLSSITVNGSGNVSREYDQLKGGVRIFEDIKIILSRGDREASENEEWSINSCSIIVFPPLNPDHEEIHLPQSLIMSSNTIGSVSANGWEIVGDDMVNNYERIVREVKYVNKKPAYYLNRQFKITCSVLEKRFVSNEFIKTITVIHASVAPSHYSHQQVSRFLADLPYPHRLPHSNPHISLSSRYSGKWLLWKTLFN